MRCHTGIPTLSQRTRKERERMGHPPSVFGYVADDFDEIVQRFLRVEEALGQPERSGTQTLTAEAAVPT